MRDLRFFLYNLLSSAAFLCSSFYVSNLQASKHGLLTFGHSRGVQAIPGFPGEAPPGTCGLVSPSCNSTMTFSNEAATISHQSLFSSTVSLFNDQFPQDLSKYCEVVEAGTLAQVVAQSVDFNRSFLKATAEKLPHEQQKEQQTPPTPPRKCMLSTQVSYSEDSTHEHADSDVSTQGTTGLCSLSSTTEAEESYATGANVGGAEVSSPAAAVCNSTTTTSAMMITSPSRNPDNLNSILPASLNPTRQLASQQSSRGEWPSWAAKPAEAAVHEILQLQTCTPAAAFASCWQDLCALPAVWRIPQDEKLTLADTPRSETDVLGYQKLDDDWQAAEYVTRAAATDQQHLTTTGLLGDVVGDPFAANYYDILSMESLIPFPEQHQYPLDATDCQLFPLDDCQFSMVTLCQPLQFW